MIEKSIIFKLKKAIDGIEQVIISKKEINTGLISCIEGVSTKGSSGIRTIANKIVEQARWIVYWVKQVRSQNPLLFQV